MRSRSKWNLFDIKLIIQKWRVYSTRSREWGLLKWGGKMLKVEKSILNAKHLWTESMHFFIHVCSFLVIDAHALCVQTWHEMSIILAITHRFLFFFHSGRHLRDSTVNSTELREIWQFISLIDWKRFIWVELSSSKR